MADPSESLKSFRWPDTPPPPLSPPFERMQTGVLQNSPDQNTSVNISVGEYPFQHYNSFISPPPSLPYPLHLNVLSFSSPQDGIERQWSSDNEPLAPSFDESEWAISSTSMQLPYEFGVINSPQSPTQERAISPANSAGSHGSGISHPPRSRKHRRSAIFADQPSDALLGSVERWDDGSSFFPRTPRPHFRELEENSVRADASSGPGSDIPKPAPTTHTKCNRCHMKKISCDGGTPCATCRRSRGKCFYPPEQGSTTRRSWKPAGRRKGPLRSGERQQAHQARKLRACLRCKFLKKTCDRGDPCVGCYPHSDRRLWQVPCTRADIKDLAYFMKDWKSDVTRDNSLQFSMINIVGFSDTETTLYTTHGYGYILPITAREILLRENTSFGVNWAEGTQQQAHHETVTAKLSVGEQGVPIQLLSDYLDHHIDCDGAFEKFVDDRFNGTPFLTQMLKTAFQYYRRTKLPILHKALKLIVAYNLTLHDVFLVCRNGDIPGKIQSTNSEFVGETAAPTMINSAIKRAIAEIWRTLQDDILWELSHLFSGVYSGDKLKHWPVIFLLTLIILALWEEMQFDCRYRTSDPVYVEKFCHDMERVPVAVLTGLFQAISQKLPPFEEWDTIKHQHLVQSDPHVCAMLTETRTHVIQFGDYLKDRTNAKFDPGDFDCLSNKFTSRLVLRTT